MCLSCRVETLSDTRWTPESQRSKTKPDEETESHTVTLDVFAAREARCDQVRRAAPLRPAVSIMFRGTYVEVSALYLDRWLELHLLMVTGYLSVDCSFSNEHRCRRGLECANLFSDPTALSGPRRYFLCDGIDGSRPIRGMSRCHSRRVVQASRSACSRSSDPSRALS